MKLQAPTIKLQRTSKDQAPNGVTPVLKFGIWCFSGAWSFVLGIFTVGIITAIRLYQVLVSPVLTMIFGPTAGCRFIPTCSCYAREAVQTHGAIHGSWLAAKRVCRCHPWGGSGEDPVPQTEFPISNLKSPAA
jgi:putative membrane protein insertion efficiency factor